MKKPIMVLLAIAATLPRQAAAQGQVEMIAFEGNEYCASYPSSCVMVLRAVDGSKNAFVDDAFEPAWSPDGSRIAFVRYSQRGLFVLNLGDWSFASVHNSGWSPAWSPDGRKLAFSDGELYVMNADGSNVVQLTNNLGFRGQPAWSPDGSTIAFDCEVESGNWHICAINADGTAFRRLTFDPASDSDAAFSPDGLAIAFATTRYGPDSQIAIMNFNGTGVSPVGAGTVGIQPAWSLDGTRIAFVVPSSVPYSGACNGDGYCPTEIIIHTVYVMNRDGTEPREFAGGDSPKWGLSAHPVAWFVTQGCNGLTCSFDASGSWGGNGALSYRWDFGDGMGGSGPSPNPTVTHAYGASGRYRVTLTVTDNTGVIGTQSRDLNFWPTARFTYACSGWRCTFDGSGSSDPDGSITYYSWDFGDGVRAAGSTVTHIYNAAAAFTVTLTVIDNAGGTGSQQHVVDLSNLVNTPPVASFTVVACTALSCAFDGSGSRDQDGIITTYTWVFGDGATPLSGEIPKVGHTYAAAGTYKVRLTVTDNIGATSFWDGSVTVPPPMHIGDLDGARTNQQTTWTAFVTITVHDSSHAPVDNATVSGSWSTVGTGSCTTNAWGQCTVSKSTIARRTHSVVFTILNVTNPMFRYSSGDNHDPDGDSNGTSITVSSP